MLHVGENAVYWDYNATVEKFLIDDWMRDVVPSVQTLLANYSVLTYFGNLDIILGAGAGLEAVRQFNWPGQAAFNAQQKTIWHLKGGSDVAGWVIQPPQGALTYVVVRSKLNFE